MKIVNFGSLNIDYVYSVPHIVRAGETLATTDFAQFCGGKGLNQSVAAAKAGAQVYHAGMLGSDGEVLRSELENSGVRLDYMQESSKKSGHAIIQLEPKGQNSILIAAGANGDVTKQYVDKVLSCVTGGDIVLLQNEISNVEYIIQAVANSKAKLALNPSPITPQLLAAPLQAVDILILNEVEAAAVCGKEQAGVQQTLKALAAKLPNTEIVLTLGGDGAWHYAGGESMHQEIYAMPVVDTTGAGDTFCGYFLAGVLSGVPRSECLKQASAAAGIAVSKNGAAPSIPTMQEVRQLMEA